MKQRTFYRTIFISDTHLGFRGAQAKALLSFLKSVECETLYLVGDIIDLWAMKKKIWWNDDCSGVISRILKMSQKGTKIIYIPGNHDDTVRQFLPLSFAGITVVDEAVHITVNNKQYAVIHGDRYDSVVGKMKWLAKLGSTAYDMLMTINGWLHSIRVKLGYQTYWSLAGYLKHKAKQAVNFMDDYELALAKHAQHEGCSGVICGHIHKAKISTIDSIHYINCGDWVESLTAIVETESGDFNILDWHDIKTHIELL
jgi:UDP-2,3-diacylglucosamine pyrophosphatase LpxH